MPDSAVILFEGITLNKASELLYGTEATAAERRSAPTLYLKCLENLVLGIIFGGSIATGKVAEVLPGVSPFQDLARELGLKVQEADPQGPAEVQLLQYPSELEILRDLIQKLDEAIRRDPEAWKSHARRELEGSRNDPALKVDLEDASAYVFAGRTNFWPHRELQELVPESYLAATLSTARNDLDLPAGISERALRAFLTRNVLAHLLIFRRYQTGFRRRYSNAAALHVTYATRASLVPDHGSPLWMVRQYIVPSVILKILDGSNNRVEFRNLLGDFSSGQALSEHRQLLAEALAFQSEKKIRDAERAIAALKKLSEGQDADEVRVGNLTDSRPFQLPIAVRQERIRDNYFRSLQRIFPELRLGDEGLREQSAVFPVRRAGYRGMHQQLQENSNEQWDCFISHATEDKDVIARPLATALMERGFRVWYDTFSLKLGDSLRESIERGLGQSRYGIVILSKRFFEKHWARKELNGLVTREVDNTKVILPIWHRVEFEDVRAYSPTLADRIAISTDRGLDKVIEEIVKVLQNRT
jgi:hypothetical protein